MLCNANVRIARNLNVLIATGKKKQGKKSGDTEKRPARLP
jgi:hypothetical protein